MSDRISLNLESHDAAQDGNVNAEVGVGVGVSVANDGEVRVANQDNGGAAALVGCDAPAALGAALVGGDAPAARDAGGGAGGAGAPVAAARSSDQEAPIPLQGPASIHLIDNPFEA